MNIAWALKPYTLRFKFNAGTSRGVLKEKTSWFLKAWNPSDPQQFGLGEAGPLYGLSPDFGIDMPLAFENEMKILKAFLLEDQSFTDYQFKTQAPSVRFAIEMAMNGLVHKSPFKHFDNSFSSGLEAIPINGLVWMGDESFMQAQIDEKIHQGFKCIKMKIGAIDFKTEISLLQGIRKKFNKEQLMLRVDANGAFKPKEALSKLAELAQYELHSIEQPIEAGQREAMKSLCSQSVLPIALDEELIGIKSKSEKIELLNAIDPQYIILKPSLLGGFRETQEWIDIAQSKNIGWWMTSALESNIGLNAIAQFTADQNTKEYQGLGTGQLYHNNFTSPLDIKKGHLYNDLSRSWDLTSLLSSF